jgi:hypothetical protein
MTAALLAASAVTVAVCWLHRGCPGWGLALWALAPLWLAACLWVVSRSVVVLAAIAALYAALYALIAFQTPDAVTAVWDFLWLPAEALFAQAVALVILTLAYAVAATRSVIRSPRRPPGGTA